MEIAKPLVDIAHIKRFIERFNSDGRFRPEFINDPTRGMQTLGLSIDPEVVRPIWDQTLEGNDRYDGRPLLAEYRKFYDEKMSLNHQVKNESNPSDSMMNTWRNRQIARLSTQIIDMNADILVHAPVAFELSKGCSVGCYFCSLSAPKLTDVWAYNSANQYLWRDSLQAIKEVLGTAAQWGFCYWATDPLDNPDYEHFCVDFAEILGRFPQTTTAKPLASVERTKRLLALSQQYSPKIINRFSILTNRSLHKVHESFTPEELLRVELVTLNPDSETVKTKSGRMWHIAQEKPKIWDKEVSRLRRVKLAHKFTEEQWETFFKSLDERTCSCVSGFLLNMVDRTVKLISPCVPSDKTPEGYITFDQETFSDGSDLRIKLGNLIKNNAREKLDLTSQLKFRTDLTFRFSDSGFTLDSKVNQIKFENPPRSSFLRFLGERIDKGDQTVKSISLAAQYQFAMLPAITYSTLCIFYDQGVIQEIDP